MNLLLYIFSVSLIIFSFTNSSDKVYSAYASEKEVVKSECPYLKSISADSTKTAGCPYTNGSKSDKDKSKQGYHSGKDNAEKGTCPYSGKKSEAKSECPVTGESKSGTCPYSGSTNSVIKTIDKKNS